MRINPYVKPGTGDGSSSKLKEKSLTVNFYRSSEKLSVVNDKLSLLISNNILVSNKLIWCEETVIFNKWLKQAIPAINAFYYFHVIAEKPNSKHTKKFLFSEQTINVIEALVKDSFKEYGGSEDFQTFSYEPLVTLNELRVEIRETEMDFRRGVAHNVNSETQQVTKVLNRLSTVAWILIQKERVKQGIKVECWDGTMPELEFTTKDNNVTT